MQKAFFLAFWGKIQVKSHKMRQNGLRDGHHGCPGARVFVQSGAIMDADDSMIMKQLVEQIIVGDDGIEVHFKCGIVASHEYM